MSTKELSKIKRRRDLYFAILIAVGTSVLGYIALRGIPGYPGLVKK
jgi:hypothetical protein